MGALIEPKKTSVAAHYRLVSEDERPRIKRIVDVFPVLLASIGEGWVFLLFVVADVVAFVFVRRRVPETKGRSLEEIEADLRGGRAEWRTT